MFAWTMVLSCTRVINVQGYGLSSRDRLSFGHPLTAQTPKEPPIVDDNTTKEPNQFFSPSAQCAWFSVKTLFL